MHLKCRECRENPLSVYPSNKYKPLDPGVQTHSCKRTSRFRRGAQLRPNVRHGMIQAYDRAFRFPRTLAHRAAEPGRGAVAAAAVGGPVAGKGARLSGGLHLFCRARVLPARRPAAASRRARRGIGHVRAGAAARQRRRGLRPTRLGADEHRGRRIAAPPGPGHRPAAPGHRLGALARCSPHRGRHRQLRRPAGLLPARGFSRDGHRA